MKNSFLFSCLISFLFVAATFAQYPKNEVIQPYPKPVKEKILVQRFHCNTAEGSQWKALHHSKLTATDKTIQIESSGHDPYVLLPNIQKPVAGTFEFRICMKNKMKPSAEIFWGTSARPGSHPDFSVRFGFLQNEDWHRYSVIFETAEPLTQLRFDPGTSAGVCEIEWIELYQIVYGEAEHNPVAWFDSNWADKVENWKTISSEKIQIRFDEKGTGAQIFVTEKLIGEIYPLSHSNPALPLGGVAAIPFYREEQKTIQQTSGGVLALKFLKADAGMIEFAIAQQNQTGTLKFEMTNNELHFASKSESPFFSPVFRPHGTMQQAVLCGIEYLEQGEHSSSTADIETKEHLRYAPKPLDITIPFMSIVTERVGFGLLWDNAETQAVFATPDFILNDSIGHYLGLYGTEFSGTLKIQTSVNRENPLQEVSSELTPLDELILWAVKKQGLPDLPKRFRDDEAQRKLNLAAYEQSAAADPSNGWRHAVIPGVEKQTFPSSFGVDYVTAIWQLTGKLPETPHLNHGGAHLRNPAAFFLENKTAQFRDHCRNEGQHLCKQQRQDGAYLYSGEFLKGHWENSASGHCGNALFRLLYDYRITGEPDFLTSAIKGLEFANKYSVPRGAQVWELSLHTPDIMGSSRMCMANIWAFEATGNKKYLDAARRWAITGLPFVYLWQSNSIKSRAEGAPEIIMKYATTPVFGATQFHAPNWIGLPVQWCGLDYSEALFLLAEYDKTLDWRRVAEGILIVAEQMQYPDGLSIGLLPDSFSLAAQQRNVADINPTVLVMQRRKIQDKLESIDVVVSQDGKYRVVSPFKTTLENRNDNKTVAVIESVAGISYQILVNGNEIKNVTSQGTDRVELP